MRKWTCVESSSLQKGIAAINFPGSVEKAKALPAQAQPEEKMQQDQIENESAWPHKVRMWCEYEAQLAGKLKDIEAERKAQAEVERMQQQQELRVLKAKWEQQRIEEAAKWQKKLHRQKVELERTHKIQLAEATNKVKEMNQLISKHPKQQPDFKHHAVQEQKKTFLTQMLVCKVLVDLFSSL